LKGVLGDLRDWSKNVIGDLDKRISKIKKRTGTMEEKGYWSRTGPEGSIGKYRTLIFRCCIAMTLMGYI
jgi:hypothetical protein